MEIVVAGGTGDGARERADRRITFTAVLSDPPPEGYNVCLRGSARELGRWEVGIPLEPGEHSGRTVWRGFVDFPPGWDDKKDDDRGSSTYWDPTQPYGGGGWGVFAPAICEVKYTLERDGHVQYQSGATIDIRRPVKDHYWHRPNFPKGGMATYSYTGSAEAFATALRSELADLRMAVMSPAMFLERFKELESELRTYACDVEEVLDAIISALPERGLNENFVLCVAAIMGHWRTLGAGRWRPGGASLAAHGIGSIHGGAGATKDERKVRPWCRFVVEATAMNPPQHVERELGSNHRWAIQGLGEAADRMYKEGSFEWLPLLTLLKQTGSAPTVRSATDLGASSRRTLTQGFERAAAAAMGAAEAEASTAWEGLSEDNPEESPVFSHLKSLIGYSPSVGALMRLALQFTQLVDAGGGTNASKALRRKLLDAVVGRFRSVEFEAGDRAALENAIEANPDLACEAMAVALLDNPTMPGKHATEADLLALVSRVTSGRGAPGEPMVAALRKWLRAEYCKEEPKEDDDADDSPRWGGGYGSMWGAWDSTAGGRRSKPKKDPVEEAKKRDEQLTAAIAGWARWLGLTCFAEGPESTDRARSIAFEISQAHFVKQQDPHALVRSIIRLQPSLAAAHFALGDELARLARHATLGVQEGAMLGLLTSSAHGPPSARLRFDLALHLATARVGELNTGTPALRPLLQHRQMWEQLLTWKEAREAAGHPLADACQRVQNRIVAASDAVTQESMELAELRSVLEVGAGSLERLAAAVGVPAAKDMKSILSNCSTKLAAFDRRLAMVQCYVSLFCRSVGLDVEELEDELEAVQARLGELQLGEVETLFADLPVLPLIPWLYELRGSEVFLELWTQVVRRSRECGPSMRHKELTPEEAEALAGLQEVGVELQVSNCGDERVRGYYVRLEDRNGRRQYTKVDDEEVRLYWNEGSNEWRMYCTGGHPHGDATLYRCRREDPIPIAGWEVHRGAAPAPTVTPIEAMFDPKPEGTWEVETDEGWKAWAPPPGVAFRAEPGETFTYSISGNAYRAVFTSIEEGYQENTSTGRRRGLRRVAGSAILASDAPEDLIARARDEYLALAGRTSTGTAAVGELGAFVQLSWSQVKNELELMRDVMKKAEGADASARVDWVPKALESVRALRDLARVQGFAPAMLHLREALLSLFVPTEGEGAAPLAPEEQACISGLEKVVEATSAIEGCAISEVAALIAPCSSAMAGLSENQVDFVTALASHDGLLQWLLKAADTEQFNRLIKVVRPYTDNPRLLEALASLQQLRTRLATLLYEKPPFPGLASFLKELSSIEVGSTEMSEMQTVQATFELVLELLTSHTRAPGVQALHEMKTITDTGKFIFRCTHAESEKLICRFGDGRTLSFEELVEMRRLLLMTDIPQELEGAAEMPQLVADFVAKLQLMEDMGNIVTALFTEGHFLYPVGELALELGAGQSVEALTERLQALEAQLEAWRNAMHASRSTHYFLNHFRARELQLLAVELLQLSSNEDEAARSAEVWSRVWPLLRLVAPAADSASLAKHCTTLAAALPRTLGAEDGRAMLEGLGSLLTQLFQDVIPTTRQVPVPRHQRDAVGDLLIHGSSGGHGARSVFVCQAENEAAVTELVLSVYARRGRLPEPEEVLMCTEATSLEEVELLLRRFARARTHSRGDRLYCVANIHHLPYAVQCGAVEALRRIEAAPSAFEDASALLFLSGQADQMLLNALADLQIPARPLSRAALRSVLEAVAERFCGSVEAVASEINGGGKTHHVLRRVYKLQEEFGGDAMLHYVAVRETTTARELVDALLADPTSPEVPTALYIDLAHILPVSADVWLFELLVVGALRDPVGGRVYHRRPQDHFLFEVPNSPHERTAACLAFCALLPVTFLRMDPSRLEFEGPVFPGLSNLLVFAENKRLTLTCHFLQAMNLNKFQPGGENFDPNWQPEFQEPVSPQDGYRLLQQAVCGDGSPPSFQLFANFANIVGAQCDRVQGYELLNMELLQLLEMPDLRHCFCRMLLETSADFSLRQIPKVQLDFEAVQEFQRAAEARALAIAARAAAQPSLKRERSSGRPGVPQPQGLLREKSGGAGKDRDLSGQALAELIRARSDMGTDAAVEHGGAGRIESASYVRRFESMISWEHSEHPVVIFYSNEFGAVEGLDVFSLNPRVVDNYIGRNLKGMLESQGIKFGKDWKAIKGTDAVRNIRRVEGWTQAQVDTTPPPASYVVTVDNFLKVLSIQMRLNHGLPVVLMGETGCGKTALVRFFAECLGYELRTLDVHGGISDTDVTNFVRGCVTAAAQLTEGKKLLVFLDEINAANCMGLFKTILVDRRLGGQLIPETVRLIACCNPYRLRHSAELEEVALVYNHHAKDSGGLADPMRHLVYRVHPLPESLIDIVYDFGALSEATEELYVEAVLRRELPDFEKDTEEGASGEDVLTVPLAGEAGRVRTEHAVLLERPESTIVVDINCLDNEEIQAAKGTAFGVTDDTRKVWLGTDIAATFEVKILDTTVAARAEERRKKQKEIKEAKEKKKREEQAARAAQVGIGFYGGGGAIGGSYYSGVSTGRQNYGYGQGVYAGGGMSYGVGHYGGWGGGGVGGGWGGGYWQPQPNDYEQFLETFKALICASQCFVREANGGERSVVSLRDVARAAKVFKWFLRYYSELQGDFVPSEGDRGAEHIHVTEELRPHLRSAVILTLGYCYHSRLTRDQRAGYRQRLCAVWRTLLTTKPAVKWLNLDSPEVLLRTIESTQHAFVEPMNLGEGIALNEALRENLFMLLVSIMNKIPILVVGKPGCSKSLAIEVLQSNLNGEVSANNFFKSMPAVEVFPYQCSPLSTPEGVQGAFDSARKYRVEGSKTIVCVLLDEVGLAEESPHLPLKVLHRELEHLGGLACVGISNWTLDAAKMSRCVTLYRPAPTVDDLCATAEGMVQSSNLKAYLQSLSRAFFEVYGSQQRPDFWGMREFYSTVRVINAELRRQVAESEALGKAAKAMILEPEVLMKTVLRNYGGRPQSELDLVVEEFFRQCGMSSAAVPRPRTQELIRQNLEEPEARHLMLLTRNNAALQLLFESGLLSHDRGAEVLFGSTFSGDQGDVAVASNLQSIKAMMRMPIVLVLVHCDALYESLYDLLNQHYMEYGGQRYVRIAHGSSSRQCPLHRLFRVVVITEVGDAYHRLAPPLLNRFEKQIFLRETLLCDEDQQVVSELLRLVGAMTRDVGYSTVAAEDGDKKEGSTDVIAMRKLLPGSHPGLLASLAVAVRVSLMKRSIISDSPLPGEAAPEEPGQHQARSMLIEAARRLVWVMQPESVCACIGREGLEAKRDFGLDVVNEYFNEQCHSDLPQYVRWLEASKRVWCDDRGAQTCILTRMPAGMSLTASLDASGIGAESFALHELTSSNDLERSISEFYAGSKPLLLIRVDLAVCSMRMLEHCRFMCEKCRIAFLGQADAATGGDPRFVAIIVHLQQGGTQQFSFDFDAKWWYAFLDILEPTTDTGLPSLTQMLKAPLLDVVKGLDGGWLMTHCFRGALARLVYPHARTADELRAQIHQLLGVFRDTDFVDVLREPFLAALSQSKATTDLHWYASIATNPKEVALAGTFQAALHKKIVTLQTEALVVLLGHLDRNSGLAVFTDPRARERWLAMARYSLRMPGVQLALSQGIAGQNTGLHDVGHDALTVSKPFQARFPFSWTIAAAIESLRPALESVAPAELPGALASQFQLMDISHTLDPKVEGLAVEDYIYDFSSMHVPWSPRVKRTVQADYLKLLLVRSLKRDAASVLDVHAAFWPMERHVRFGARLLDAVPNVVDNWRSLIPSEIGEEELNLQLIRTAMQTLLQELLERTGDDHDRGWLQEWLVREEVAWGVAQEILGASMTQPLVDPPPMDGVPAILHGIRTEMQPKLQTARGFVRSMVLPLRLPHKDTARWLKSLTEAPYTCATLAATMRCASELLGAAAESKDSMAECCAEFLEYWILDVCLVDNNTSQVLPDDCLDLLCGIAAGQPAMFGPDGTVIAAAVSMKLPNAIAMIEEGILPRSRALDLAMLRRLLSPTGPRQERTRACIFELLRQGTVQEGHIDTKLATHVVAIEEELADVRLATSSGWSLDRAEVFASATPPNATLCAMAEARCVLSRYAKALLAGNEEAIQEQQEASTTALEDQTDASVEVPVRSMRLLVLKHLQHSVGTAQVRTMLAGPPLASAPWVLQWGSMGDVAFERFVGAARLPQWNPFLDVKGYMSCSTVLGDFMASNDVAKLDAFGRVLESMPYTEARRGVGCFLMALFEEPGLRKAIEEPGKMPPWRPLLMNWLRTTMDLPLENELERNLLLIFAGDAGALVEPLVAVRAEDAAALSLFVLSYEAPMDQMLRLRVLAHMAAALISAPGTSILALLRELVFAPEELVGKYLPGMEEDLRAMLQSAMQERDTNIWTNSAHWYTCAKGHQYFIADCGRPMVEARCPECGEKIGGRDHASVAGNVAMEKDADASPSGYTFKSVEEEDADSDAFRGISRTTARAIRLLLHGTMLLGLAARAPRPSLEDAIAAQEAVELAQPALQRNKSSGNRDTSRPLRGPLPLKRQAGTLRPGPAGRRADPYSRDGPRLRAPGGPRHGAAAPEHPFKPPDGPPPPARPAPPAGGPEVAALRVSSVPAAARIGREELAEQKAVERAARRRSERSPGPAGKRKRERSRERSQEPVPAEAVPELAAAAPPGEGAPEEPPPEGGPPPSNSTEDAAAAAAAAASRFADVNAKAVAESGAKDIPLIVYSKLANRDCTNLGPCEANFILIHFLDDWRRLVDRLGTNTEDLAGALHMILLALRESVKDSLPGAGAAPASWAQLTLDARLQWEKVADTRYLAPCWDSFGVNVPAAMQRWGGGEAEMLVAELREAMDFNALQPTVRRQQLPAVLAYRSEPSLAGLHAVLSNKAGAKNNYPLVSMLVEPPLLDFLAALQHLAAVFRWHQLLAGRFNCRLERAHARNTAVSEVIATLVPTEERGEWLAAFDGYCHAWDAAWRFVDRYECMTIPQEYKDLQITRDTPLSFLIADLADEGLCPLAFTQWLVQQHNQIVSMVAAVRGEESALEVSSRLLGKHETLRYDQAKLMRFLRTRCLAYGTGGRLEYDLATLERQLRRELHVPLVKWEHKKFRFLEDQAAAASVLRAALPQRPLAKDLEARILADLSTAATRGACAQLVEQSIAFILSTGAGAALGEDAGATLLSAYLQNVLLVSEQLPSKAAESEVRLWHLDALLKLLRSAMELDPMEGVAPKYRAPLEPEAEAALKDATPGLDLPVLLPAIQSFAAEQLKEEYISADESMKAILAMVETDSGGDLGDVLWFQEHFPEDVLQMRHWVEVFKALSGH